MTGQSVKPAIVTLSFDDGDPRDLEIARLLRRYELKATFYVPITNIEGRPTLNPAQIVQLSEMGFEIGAHGYHHRYLNQIPATEVFEEIRSGRDRLEEILGRRVTCFCYPGGKTPHTAVRALRQLKFEYARTARDMRFLIKNPLLAPTTLPIGKHCKRHYIKEAFLALDIAYFCFFCRHHLWTKTWDEIALATLDYALGKASVWHLWGHAFEIDKNNDWDRLEKIFKKLRRLKQRGLILTCVNSESLQR